MKKKPKKKRVQKTVAVPVDTAASSRLNTLDLALLNCANYRLEAARSATEAKLLQARLHGLEHISKAREIADQVTALMGAQRMAEQGYQELAARLAKDYAVDLKTCAIEPETGIIQKNEA